MGIKPVSERPGWQALQAHYEKLRSVHLRELFVQDPARGERLAPDAAAIYFGTTYTSPDETIKLLQLAEQPRRRARIDAQFRGDKINVSGAARRPHGACMKLHASMTVRRMR